MIARALALAAGRTERMLFSCSRPWLGLLKAPFHPFTRSPCAGHDDGAMLQGCIRPSLNCHPFTLRRT